MLGNLHGVPRARGALLVFTALLLAACQKDNSSSSGGSPSSSGGSASAATESVLYSFNATGADGTDPYGKLVQGKNGNFYGTTYTGGANGEVVGQSGGDGTVFMVTLKGVETVLYSFGANSTDGINPENGLVEDSKGNFYGVTANGGTFGAVGGKATGNGTVFKITAAGVYTQLHSFGATGGDASGPATSSGLILGTDGNLYGTTANGGANGNGAIFEITPAGIETVLYSFGATGTDGIKPQAGLILGADGNFYGTTTGGGASGNGTVFEFTPAGIETVLYSFTGEDGDGALPTAGLTLGADGNFYGVTLEGGSNNAGAFYRITLAGVETPLYSFGRSAYDTSYPYEGLALGADGNFYATSDNGGLNGEGVIYGVTPTGEEEVLYSFGDSLTDGSYPQGVLTLGKDGSFYGLTSTGGANQNSAYSDGGGTFFKFTPPNP